jgi:hypothetical protein
MRLHQKCRDNTGSIDGFPCRAVLYDIRARCRAGTIVGSVAPSTCRPSTMDGVQFRQLAINSSEKLTIRLLNLNGCECVDCGSNTRSI